MTYLVDTDWVVDFLAGQALAIELLDGLLPAGIAISIITDMGVLEGIIGGREPKQAESVYSAFLAGIDMLGISRAISRRAAPIRPHCVGGAGLLITALWICPLPRPPSSTT